MTDRSLTHDEVLAIRRQAQETPPGPDRDKLDRLWRAHVAEVMCDAVIGHRGRGV